MTVDDVKKLSPKEGDVLLFNSQCPPSEMDIEAIGKQLKDCGLGGILFIFLAKGDSLELMDEKAMREHGWVRAK